METGGPSCCIIALESSGGHPPEGGMTDSNAQGDRQTLIAATSPMLQGWRSNSLAAAAREEPHSTGGRRLGWRCHWTSAKTFPLCHLEVQRYIEAASWVCLGNTGLGSRLLRL